MAKNKKNYQNKGNNNQNKQNNNNHNQMTPTERLASMFDKKGNPTLNQTNNPNRQGDIIKVLLDRDIIKNDPSLLIDAVGTDDIVREILEGYDYELFDSDIDEVAKNILEITKDQNMRTMHNVSDDFRTLWEKVFEKYNSLNKDTEHPVNCIFDDIVEKFDDEIAEYDAYVIAAYVYVNSALNQLIFPEDQDNVRQAASTSTKTIIDVEATVVDVTNTIDSLAKLAAKELFKDAWSAVRNHLVSSVSDTDLIKAIEVASEKVISNNYNADEIKNCDPVEVLDDMKQLIINEVVSQCLNLTLSANTTDNSEADEKTYFAKLIDRIPEFKKFINEKQFNKISDELNKIDVKNMSDKKKMLIIMDTIEKVIGKDHMYDVIKLIASALEDLPEEGSTLPAVAPHVRSTYVKNIIDISYEDTIEEFPELKNIFTEDEYYRVIDDVEDAGLVIKTELDVVRNKEKLAEFTKNAIGARKHVELRRVLEKYGTDVIFTHGPKSKTEDVSEGTSSSSSKPNTLSRKINTSLKFKFDELANGLEKVMGYCDDMRAEAALAASGK